MKTLRFTNNDGLHAIGLGTWKAKGAEVKKAVKDALYAGYRHIDTAAVYGNEKDIGEALEEVFSEGDILREDVFITSKLWNDAHQKAYVIPAIENSLKNLKLDYLDLYLIHWPVAFKPGIGFPERPADYIPLKEVPLSETWAEFEQAKNEGLVKHIGVSNFNITNLKKLIAKASQNPEMNQVELHPYLQQDELLEYCASHNILVTGYSPLGSGDRSDQMKANDEPKLMEIPEIVSIAKKHMASAAQVLIAWQTERGTAVIPKSTTKENIIDNFKASGIQLDEDDMKTIKNLNRNYRFITGKFFECPEMGYNSIYEEI